jgi:hypothetical protein
MVGELKKASCIISLNKEASMASKSYKSGLSLVCSHKLVGMKLSLIEFQYI